jgi:hypothetical protein
MKAKKSNPLLLALVLLIASLFPLLFVLRLNNVNINAFIPSVLKNKLKNNNQKGLLAPLLKIPENKVLFGKKGDTEVYKIQKGDQWVVVIDGQEGQLYDAVDNPTFSPDGDQFVYSASLAGEEFVVVDNAPQEKKYTDILQILFGPNGDILAYLAESESGSVVVVNGVEGKFYEDIGTLKTETGTTFLTFSPDGKSIVYRATEGQKTFIVVDTKEGKKYAEISEIYFSSDGKQIAYYAKEGDKVYTIINNQVTEVKTIDPDAEKPPVTNDSTTTTKKNKNDTRNLSPDIDNQPDRLSPLICGQTTDCNF